MGTERFLELSLDKSMSLLQWTSLGPDTFSFSKFPTWGRRERWGSWGVSIKEKPEKIKGGKRVVLPSSKTARALEPGCLRNFCSVPGKCVKTLHGLKREATRGPGEDLAEEGSK